MAERRNHVGAAYSLDRVRADRWRAREPAAGTAIESLPVGADSPLARLGGAALLAHPHLPRARVPGRRSSGSRDRLRSSHLVFTSTFDGELEPYLDAICARLGAEADTWWGTAPATRQAATARRSAASVRDHQIDSSLFASAHPDASVRGVLESLALRERIVDFAAAAQGLAAAELQAAFRGAVHARCGSGGRRTSRAGATSRHAIDLADIQGNVLRGYTYPYAAYVFLRVVDVARARALLRAAAAAGRRRPSRGPTGRRRRRCTSRSRPPGCRRWGCRKPCSTRSRTSSARAWRRAPSGSAIAGRARPSTGTPVSGPARPTRSSRSTPSTTSGSTRRARRCAVSARGPAP